METRMQGAWIVHHAGKLEEHGTSGGLDSLRKAGQLWNAAFRAFRQPA